MLIVLFVIFLLMIGIGLFIRASAKSYQDGMEFFGGLGAILGCVCEFIVVITIITCCYDVSQSKVIDRKINMYQEENANIEKEITNIVNSYKDYEKEIISNISDMEVLFIKIPELKSSELVKTQMNTYMENNKKIKELKEEKINYNVSKWWIYFGGK